MVSKFSPAKCDMQDMFGINLLENNHDDYWMEYIKGSPKDEESWKLIYEDDVSKW